MGGIRGPLWLGVAATVAAFVVLALGLDDVGFWTNAELPVVDRSRAALGESLSGLLRSPWFPDAVRTALYGAMTSEFGIRLPHAASVAALAGIATGLVRARGASVLHAGLAGLVLLSFPAAAIAGRTVLGNPIGELMVVAAVLAGVQARRASSLRTAASWAGVGLLLLGLSVASLGLVFGAAAPLLAVAVAGDDDENLRMTWMLGTAALAVVAVAVLLAQGQGEGYIPVLGAAKDLDLMERPEHRRYAAAIEDLGYQIFPWAGLALAGAVRPQARWPALWALSTMALAIGWSLVYGASPIPIAVPAALCVVAGVETLRDPDTPRNLRRATVLLAIAAILVMRKDAELYPSRIAVPLHDFEGEHQFPAEASGAPKRLRKVAGVVGLAVLLGAVLARRRDDEGGWEAFARRIPASFRDASASAVVVVAAAYGAWTMTHDLVPALGQKFSVRGPLRRYQQWVDAGELTTPLGTHRARDAGLPLYGPDELENLESRHSLFAFMQQAPQRAAFVRTNDVAALHQHAHLNDWSLHVLDDSHAQLRLVANALPAGTTDLNRVPEFLVEQPPQLAHETLVQFEQYVKVIGWEVSGPLVRGTSAQLRVVFEVLRPLPGGSKLYTRFMGGRLSKINTDPVDFVEGVYPCNLWRPGDFIVHAQTFDVPVLEILPGTYDFVLGIRRGERTNFGITIPSETKGEFGVLVRDKKRNFAKVGEVEVW